MSYKVIKIVERQRVYYQVRKEDAVYPPIPVNSVSVCMEYGIQTAQEAVKLRDKLTSHLKKEK